MKFNCSVVINLNRARVIELFDSVDNLKEWQDGFISFEPLEGELGANGSTARMKYKMGKREMELIETVINNNFPESFAGQYESKHTLNTMVNRFTELSPTQTRYDAEIEYTELRGFMMKAMAFLMPGMFKKQTQKWLNQFRDFAERVG